MLRPDVGGGGSGRADVSGLLFVVGFFFLLSIPVKVATSEAGRQRPSKRNVKVIVVFKEKESK